jgi:hypothetical protein
MPRPLTSPYPADGPWLKGNIHTHTTASDGHHDPQEVVNWYATHSYDFLALTDHNLVLPLGDLDSREMLLVSGEELTHPRTHVVGLGISETLPRGESTQEQIDLVREAGGLAVVAHPNWMGLSVEDLLPLSGHLAIELSNQVCYRLNGKGDSVAWWDALLAAGRRCWGVAVDDMHSLEAGDGGGGWVMVAAAERTWESIRAALEAGAFYASCGPAFEAIEVRGRTIAVETSPCAAIRFIGRDGRLLQGWQASSASPVREAQFTLPEHEPFVRLEIADAAGKGAWTQPFWSA